MFAAIIATLLFSFSVVFGHRSAKLLGGAEANFWRLVTAGALLGMWSFAFGRGLEGSGLALFVLSGLAGIGVGDVAFFQALPRLGSRLTVLLTNCLSPPIAAVAEWIWMGTTLSTVQIVAGVITLSGVGIALAPGERLKFGRKELLIGISMSVVSSFGGAIGAVLSRKAYAVMQSAGEHLDGANAAFQRVTGGLVLGGLFVLWARGRAFKLQSNAAPGLAQFPSIKKKWSRAWPWVLLNALAGMTIGVSFMQRALETTPTGIVLAIIAMTPIIVIPLAILFEDERPDKHSVLGSFVAVFGLVFLYLVR